MYVYIYIYTEQIEICRIYIQSPTAARRDRWRRDRRDIPSPTRGEEPTHSVSRHQAAARGPPISSISIICSRTSEMISLILNTFSKG